MRFPRTLGRIDLAKTEELITHAVDKGLNYFDTAWMYPGSEETLGTIFKKNNLREKVFIATKLPIILLKASGDHNSDYDKYFNQSLERLKTDYIDYYLLHMLTDFDH
jgi:predicted aldo/keto reductase-like oxidoreductase